MSTFLRSPDNLFSSAASAVLRISRCSLDAANKRRYFSRTLHFAIGRNFLSEKSAFCKCSKISIESRKYYFGDQAGNRCLLTRFLRISASFIDLLSQRLTHSHRMRVHVFLTGVCVKHFCVATTCQQSIAPGWRPVSFI